MATGDRCDERFLLPEDGTAMGGAEVGFPHTTWSQIVQAGENVAVLAALCKRYWKPVYFYLRCKGVDNEMAKDLVQDFFSEKVLGQQFFRKADPNKGRFRTFLMAAISNFATDKLRRHKPTVSLEEDGTDASYRVDPDMAFNQIWADELLQSVLEELKDECFRNERRVHWELFHRWFLDTEPGQKAPGMEVICAECGLESTKQAYNIITAMKRRFRTILRRRLRPLVATEADVDDEINTVIGFYGQGGLGGACPCRNEPDSR